MKRAALLLALAACGRMNFDPIDDGGGTNGNGDGNGGGGDGNGGDSGGGGAACTMINGPSCPGSAASLFSAGTYMGAGDTVPLGNGQTGSCGGGSTGEYTIQFLVMSTATFVFTTRNSGFDTVLYAKDTCTGAELACNDDEDGTTKTSRISLALTAGQRIVVMVDGANNQCGTFTLRAGLNP